MIRIEQTIKHDPPHSYGNCHQAAWAMVLGVPLEQVPHMCDGTTNNLTMVEQEFLASLGLAPAYLTFQDISWTMLLDYLSAMCVGCPCVIGGTVPRGFGHSVAFHNGVVYDPHPSQEGLAAPHKEDGMWWVTFPVRRLA